MPRVAVLVSSCCGYVQKTIPLLLETMRDAGVSANDVYVVVGGAPDHEQASFSIDGFRVSACFVTHNNFDNTALIWAVEHLRGYDYAFLLHDTTAVLPGFAERLLDVPSAHADAAAIRLSDGEPSMSMGWYCVDALKAAASAIVALKSDAVGPEALQTKAATEDAVFEIVAAAGGRVTSIAKGPSSVMAQLVTTYGGVERRVEQWDTPGLLKFKANWNVRPMHAHL